MASPSVARIAVTPTVSPSNSNKRRITPSAESSSSKRLLILTDSAKGPKDISPGTVIPTQPYFAPKQLFPQGRAKIATPYTHAHPSAKDKEQQKPKGAEVWNARHVLLPFDPREVNLSKPEYQSLLRSIFPETFNVGYGRVPRSLLFQVESMPRGLWPVSVGGFPYTVSDGKSGRVVLFKGGVTGLLSLRLFEEGYDVASLSTRGLRKLTTEVHTAFKQNLPDVEVVEFILTCEDYILIVVADHVDLKKRTRLPGVIAKCVVKYFHNSEFHRPSWADRQAKRQTEPNPAQGVVDKTVYDVMRPGVMISSMGLKDHGHPAEYSTTSGILVKNPGGYRLMTAATHGIGDDGLIWQTDDRSLIIGEATQEIPFTDISLVDLRNDVDFSNQTFENDAGVTPSFTRLASMDDIRPYTICHLNSPYTGNMEGNIVMRSIKLEPSKHPAEERIEYVPYEWFYTNQVEGNDEHVQPPDDTCGSVIWDDNGVVLGFYHYYIAEGHYKGFSVTVSASELSENGWRLA
ncbi:hypothetical protein PG985_001779 [Apiospora marii]|uniref:Uncharacterized protein n=1 Tax=Apiospora marii TaxID=335849 RepID=A0ABR1S1P9_9PEZI